jgi:hypothetical protein
MSKHLPLHHVAVADGGARSGVVVRGVVLALRTTSCTYLQREYDELCVSLFLFGFNVNYNTTFG